MAQSTVTSSSDYYNISYIGTNYNGCPFGKQVHAIVNKVNQTKVDCGCGKDSKTGKPLTGCTTTPSGLIAREYDRSNADFIKAYTKDVNMKALNVIYASDIGYVGSCTTDSTGSCIVGVSHAGPYLSIIKYTGPVGAVSYKGVLENLTSQTSDKEKDDDDNDRYNQSGDYGGVKQPLNEKNCRFVDTFSTDKNNKQIETIVPAQGAHFDGSALDVIYPQSTVWESGTELYPFIMTSDSDWTTDVCLQVPTGYQIAAVYDEEGNILPTGQCQQTFVSGETKVVLFSVNDTGSPEPDFTFTLNTKHQETPTAPVQEINKTISIGGVRQVTKTVQDAILTNVIAPITAKVEAAEVKIAQANEPTITSNIKAEIQALKFDHNIGLGKQGADVKALQAYLNDHGFIVSQVGAGSKGFESIYFGLKTKAAVIKYQRANGVSTTGFVGPMTRALLNK